MIEQLFLEEETLLAALGLAVVGIAAYLIAGLAKRREVPASVEERIDDVVGTLNATFGKDWSEVEARTLKARLRGMLPARLLSLVDVVHMIEDSAAERALSGQTKRWWASQLALRAGLA